MFYRLSKRAACARGISAFFVPKGHTAFSITTYDK
jgi:hypothetical protein